MKLLFRPEAEADLAAIAVYIAESSIPRAKKVVTRLRGRCSILARSPLAGRPRPELGEGLRSLVERPYLVIYRVEATAIEIVGFLHGGRDLPKALAKRINEEGDS